MTDPRLEVLAETLTGYATGVKRGDIVLIHASGQESFPLVKAVQKAALKAGARCVQVDWDFVDLTRQFLDLADPEQLAYFPQHRLDFMRQVDAYIGIGAPDNVMTMARVDQEKMVAFHKLLHPIVEERVKNSRWVVTRYPTHGLAQDARMSLEEYEDFFFAACNLDWENESRKQSLLKDLMEQTDQVRIVASDTDLRFSLAGMPAIKCDGHFNMPDGEVFSAPVRESVEGFIVFNAPSLYQGREFNRVRLGFSQGRIVEAVSAENSDDLNRILDTDEGARYIGEFAIGLNPRIVTPMRNILFDEKIFGSIHLTPGACYDECDNGNHSAVHWDLVKILAGDGTIFFDDVPVQKDGRFVHPALLTLNP